ncbi:FAD-dependent oxidoreductase [Leekyejoonella antrihumi]|uniref:CoA-disulfide reductase n=1 Tax=Leekyejoonella antrihumi TaxID=1660198 RepID=A0A563E666_9MICO|nr:FAD-dependent oxidoreductase [Leekyejoonella antrihumi]TWP38030.1 CoA-disulfide reductase [Leekyejoonella antrihumi]
MARTIVIIGGSAAGMGAAGAAQQVDPDVHVIIYTELADVGYSPCGIPYVHGKEIDSFDRLILQGKEFYADRGFDIHYETVVSGIDTKRHTIDVPGEGSVGYDQLVIATGFKYEQPKVPGSDLGNLYYVRDIRAAQRWDKILDSVHHAVIADAQPIGVEMATALAHRGIETHLVDPHPWPMAEITDPDIMEPVEESWRELGVHLHLNTRIDAFLGTERVQAVRTSNGDIAVDMVVVGTKKLPNNDLAAAAGVKCGSTGGLIVDEHMRTSVPDVFAAGDCVEVPQGTTGVPVQGLSGSHAYAQGKIAGSGAAGTLRSYSPVYVPWGLVAGKWMVGGVSFGETLAGALGIPYVKGVAEGISRARYYPGFKKIRVKLLAEPGTLKLIGAQLVGGEGIKERCDFLAMAARKGLTLHDIAWMENVYSPAMGALAEPMALAAQNGLTAVQS